MSYNGKSNMPTPSFGGGSTTTSGYSGPTFNSKSNLPAEDVTFRVFSNQIVVLDLPYKTKRSFEIREFVKNEIFYGDPAIAIWRFSSNPPMWSNVIEGTNNISLRPYDAINYSINQLTKCPAIRAKFIAHGNTGQPMTIENVRTMEFTPLPNESATADQFPAEPPVPTQVSQPVPQQHISTPTMPMQLTPPVVLQQHSVQQPMIQQQHSAPISQVSAPPITHLALQPPTSAPVAPQQDRW